MDNIVEQQQQQGTIEELIKRLNIIPKYELKNEDMIVLLYATNTIEGFYNTMEIDNDQPPILKLLLKRVKVSELDDSIATSALLLPILYEIPTPGIAVLYLITLLDHAEQASSAIDFEYVVRNIYPYGFYSEKTAIEIIDKIIKPGLAKNGYIY